MNLLKHGVCCFAILLFAATAHAQDLKYIEYDTDLIPGQVYKARREKLMEKIGNEAVAIFYSNPERNRNADLEYFYFQNDAAIILLGRRRKIAVHSAIAFRFNR